MLMIKELPESVGSVLGFEVSCKVTSIEKEKWIAQIELVLLKHEKLSVLIVLDEDAGWNVDAGIDDLMWLFKHIKNMDKIAVVSSSKVWKWLVTIDGLFAPMMGVGEKHFEPAELETAWAWVKS
jgi:hypothetical protein